ncbi:MAG: histidine phosphatase family protein [Ruminococcaceae bacterium]|nr:histidine phosphatase family protein [Oscillospiraceae bacterium]
MRILLIRHGDPDYANDTVTEKGKREVRLLADRLANEKIDKIYCSPLGRAQDTAAPTAEKIGLTIETLPWLKEIDIHYNMVDKRVSPWDIYPHVWTENPAADDKENWARYSIYDSAPIGERVKMVETELDALLLSHGFRHIGRLFEILPGYESSTETIALFCHMGLGNTLLSHLAGIATPLWWHTVFLPPTSVTTVYLEQHCSEKPIALAHFAGIGDISHLYAGGEPASTSGLKNCRSPLFPPEPIG